MVSAIHGMTGPAADSGPSAAPSSQPCRCFGSTLAETSGAPEEYSVSPALRQLFPGGSAPPEPAPEPAAPQTAADLFGPSPWLSNPTERLPDGRELGLNPYYFATPETAATVAGILGGEVVEMNAFTAEGSPVAQQQPNQMVRMPDGRLVNAGLVASYYDLGLPQSYIDQLLADIKSPQSC